MDGIAGGRCGWSKAESSAEGESPAEAVSSERILAASPCHAVRFSNATAPSSTMSMIVTTKSTLRSPQRTRESAGSSRSCRWAWVSATGPARRGASTCRHVPRLRFWKKAPRRYASFSRQRKAPLTWLGCACSLSVKSRPVWLSVASSAKGWSSAFLFFYSSKSIASTSRRGKSGSPVST